MTRRPLLLVLAALGIVLGAPALAWASSGSEQIINECANESLTRQYTQKEYQEALSDLPADLKEYTDCADVIQAAQRAAASAGKGSGPGGGGRGGAATRGAPGGGGGTGGGPSAPAAAPATAAPADPAAGAAPTPPAAAAAPGAAAPAAPAAGPDGGAAAASAADQAALQAAQRAGASPVEIGGTTLNPGDPAGVALSLSDLPTPMLVLLGLLGLVALLGLAALVKGWVLSLGRSRSAPGPG